MHRLFALALAMLLLSGCAAEEPAYRGVLPDWPPSIGPAPSAESPAGSESAAQPEKKSERVIRHRGSAGTQPEFETVSPLPPRPSLYQLDAPSLPPGTGGAAPNRGPVTGYGPGGMAQPPGAPANPPYR